MREKSVYTVHDFYKHGSLQKFMQRSKMPYLLEEELEQGARIIIEAISALHKEDFIHG